MEPFPPSFLLLQHEGYLFRSCLLTGLTALRYATASDPGNFYSAFFHLSIGTERVLKTIVVLDQIAASGSVPTNDQLRKFGHDIKQLMNSVVPLPGGAGTNRLAAFDSSAVEWELIDFLAEFAKTTRYYNLDALTQSGRGQAPLSRWNLLLQRLVRENVPAVRVMRIGQQSLDLASLMKTSSHVVAHDLDGTQMDFARMLAAPRLQELGCCYAVWHLVRVLDALNDCLYAATWRVHASGTKDQMIVPFMHEFLNFTGLKKGHVLRKKRWP